MSQQTKRITMQNPRGHDREEGDGRLLESSSESPTLEHSFAPTTILSVPTTFQLIRAGIRAKTEESLSSLMIRCGCLPRPKTLRLSRLDPTPSDATARALELATNLVPPAMVNHMIRTYYFGFAINIWKGNICIGDGGKEDAGPYAEVPFDREAFWVACLLHDAGISELLTPKSPSCKNDTITEESLDVINADTFFEVRGARRAHEFVSKELERPFSEERAWLVHEAIALHTSVANHHKGSLDHPERRGIAWAELLFDGASTDLVASQLGKVSPETIREVLKHHPKGDLHTIFPEIMIAETKARPCCAIAPHYRMGLFDVIRNSERLFSRYEV